MILSYTPSLPSLFSILDHWITWNTKNKSFKRDRERIAYEACVCRTSACCSQKILPECRSNRSN